MIDTKVEGDPNYAWKGQIGNVDFVSETVVINGTLLYKSSQIVTYAGDINILGQSKEDAVDILVKLEEVAQEFDLKINGE